nr:zinc finger, CCHC-type, retrotransposon Gag domain protein [Tanacetum cinerariifolium]
FLGAKAGTQEEQAKHFKWGLNDFVLDSILNTEFTDVEVSNATRNIEIFRDRPKNEGEMRGTETAIVYDHQKHHHRGLIRELMIEGIVKDMATMADMATETYMAMIDGMVIDKAMTDMVMVVTDREMVVRRHGVTKIKRFRANIIVVLMGKACHKATGARFECREVGHLAKDCKKDFHFELVKHFYMFCLATYSFSSDDNGLSTIRSASKSPVEAYKERHNAYVACNILESASI